jgi:ankyrin repeat protein
MLAGGASPNERSAAGLSALEQAIESRKDEIAVELFKAGADASKVDPGSFNPVWAVGTGNLDILRWTLDHGGDINADTYSGTPIHVAAREGRLEMLKLLIERGADINAGNMVGTPLGDAIENNHAECAIELLRAGAVPKPEEYSDKNLLIMAVHQRSVPMVKALLRAGHAVDQRGDIRELDEDTGEMHALYANATPLIVAAQLGEDQIVEALLRAGADPYARDEQGRRAVELAQEKGHRNIAVRLEQAMKQKPSAANLEEELLLAAEKGDLKAVQKLLAGGADVNTADPRSRSLNATPLLLAIRNGHAKLVQPLLDAGADPNRSDRIDKKAKRWLASQLSSDDMEALGIQLGRTPLHEAAERGMTRAVEMLIARGAKINAADVADDTPLHLAAQNAHTAVVDRLIAVGADVDAVNSSREDALQMAISAGSESVVQTLIAAGANPTNVTNVLDAAARAGSVAILKRLVEGIETLASRKAALSAALRSAAYEGKADAVNYLLRLGADVSAADRSGNTGLHFACTMHVRETTYENGKETVVDSGPSRQSQLAAAKALLEAGASPNAVDKEGFTPLAWAIYSGNMPLVDLLLDHGANPSYGKIGDDSVLKRAAELKLGAKRLRRLREAAKKVVKKPPAPARMPPENANKPPKIRHKPLPRPDFSAAKSPVYKKAVKALEALCGTQGHAIGKPAGGFDLHVDSRATFDFKKTRRDMKRRGYTLVWTDPLEKHRVAIFPTKEELDILQVMGTNGANYDLDTDDLVRFLRQLRREQPFEITAVAFDTVAGRFTKSIRDPKGLAKRLYAFCPDIIDQGVGTMSRLVSALKKKSADFFFWWD